MTLPTDCDIAIIGARPVGLFMANLMGLAGRRADRYEAERKPKVAAVIRLSARLGEIITPLSPPHAALRDIAFFFVNWIAPARLLLERGDDLLPPTRLSSNRRVNRRRDNLSGAILPHARPSPGTVALDPDPLFRNRFGEAA